MNKAVKSAPSVALSRLYLPMGVATLLPTFGMSISNVALPTFGVEFAQPLTQVQWVVSAYLLALTVFSLLAGRFVDQLGVRTTLVLGYAVFIVGCFVCIFSASLPILIFGRVIQGTGAAALAVVGILLAKSIGNRDNLGRAMGLLATLTAIGTALGPSIGGIVLEWFGWRSLFALLLISTGVGALSVLLVQKAEVATAQLSEPASDQAKPSLARYAVPAIANCFVSVIMMTTFIAGPFFLTYALGFSEAGVGMIMGIGPIISVLAGVPAGFLVDRWGADRIIFLGLGALIVGALMFAYLPAILAVTGYVIALIVMTPGYQMFLAANNTSVMASVSDAQKGFVSGILNMSRSAGLIVGASAIAALFMWGAGGVELQLASRASIEGAFRLVFLINAGLIAGSTALLIFAKR